MALSSAGDLPWLLSPAEARDAGARLIGGKAAGLASLAELGVRVPAWLVLPATVMEHQLETHLAPELARWRRALAELSAQSQARGEPPEPLEVVAEPPEPLAAFTVPPEPPQAQAELLGAAAAELRARITSLPLAAPLVAALAEAARRLGPGDLAVRSSAIGEDGAARSFAGQFESVLGVRGEQALADAVRVCWASAFSAHALDYHLRGAADHPLAVAVIVQRLVAGEASGVLFTTDPVSADPAKVRISACRGLGDKLVSGAVDADELVTDHRGAVLESRLSGATPVLDAATVKALVRSSLSIAAAAGAPRDIEWTVTGGQVWFLQARPITNLNAPREPAAVWDNSNIQESYFGVTTPLTFSFARAAYANVYAQTMRAVGLSEGVIARHTGMLRGLLGLIHGRVYYNLNQWYTGLLLLPAFSRNKADMERMMGVEEPVDFVAPKLESWLKRLAGLPALLRAAVGFARRFATLERDVAAFLARIAALRVKVDRPTIAGRSLAELAELLELLRLGATDNWTTPIVNDFRVMMTTGRLRRLVEGAADEAGDRLMQTLLGGADVAATAAPALLMLRMAETVSRSPAALAAITAGGEDGLRRAAAADSEFAALLQQLLDDYGDRCMGELKLESKSLRDDDRFVTTMLRNYLSTDRSHASAMAERAQAERAALEERILRRVGPLARRRLRRALDAARASIRAREAMRLERARLYGVHRQIYRAIGARLYEQGRLAAAADVFYLTVEEVDAALAADALTADALTAEAPAPGGTDLAATAASRRAVFADYAAKPAPNRLVTEGVPDPFAANVDLATAAPAAPAASGRLLSGLGCSPGVVEGPVRIVSGPDDDLAISGQVLVATRTDPGWSPLFHAASAILVERGSVLSHSAVLARELGLPAVVGIPGLVAALRNGERVRVDGTAGTVERLEEPLSASLDGQRGELLDDVAEGPRTGQGNAP